MGMKLGKWGYIASMGQISTIHLHQTLDGYTIVADLAISSLFDPFGHMRKMGFLRIAIYLWSLLGGETLGVGGYDAMGGPLTKFHLYLALGGYTTMIESAIITLLGPIGNV